MPRPGLLFLVLAVVLASCGTTPSPAGDPIADLVQRLNANHNGFWTNGLYPTIDLPPDAEIEEVLEKAVEMSGFDQGHIKTYRIQEVRQVQLDVGGSMETYSAVLLHTDLGTMILLCKPEPDNRWWSRFYIVEE